MNVIIWRVYPIFSHTQTSYDVIVNTIPTTCQLSSVQNPYVILLHPGWLRAGFSVLIIILHI